MELVLYNPFNPNIEEIELFYDGSYWFYRPFLQISINEEIPIYREENCNLIQALQFAIPFFRKELKNAFFYRKETQVLGFFNLCPHLQVPLDLDDNCFFSRNGNIICKIHGAQFSSYDGSVIHGPAKTSLYKILVEETVVGFHNFLIIKGFYK
ncbi:MAG: Rieske (2Fe-2S) protein [Leptonema sp. (in: bacteria)]